MQRSLSIKKIKNKSSMTLLKTLLEVLQQHPKPEFIRTDNEICFNSKLFKLGLWLLDIKKQTTPNHSPWCNGRIERFFGTLKSTLKTLPNKHLSKEQLPIALYEFSFWYNNIRLKPHKKYIKMV
jgi:transposase InsO family protein